MKQVWQTIDGALFSDATDAEKHEREVHNRCRMWDGEGDPTEDVMNAIVLHLKGEAAGSIFIDIAKAQGAQNYLGDIEEDTHGWFIWDEGYETYRWIDPDTLTALARIWLSYESICD